MEPFDFSRVKFPNTGDTIQAYLPGETVWVVVLGVQIAEDNHWAKMAGRITSRPQMTYHQHGWKNADVVTFNLERTRAGYRWVVAPPEQQIAPKPRLVPTEPPDNVVPFRR
jgi:hypothetical protein